MIHIQLHKTRPLFCAFSPPLSPLFRNYVPLFFIQAKEKKVFWCYYSYIYNPCFSRAIYFKIPSLPSFSIFILLIQYVSAKVNPFALPSFLMAFPSPVRIWSEIW